MEIEFHNERYAAVMFTSNPDHNNASKHAILSVHASSDLSHGVGGRYHSEYASGSRSALHGKLRMV